MFENAADIPQTHLAKACVLVPGKQGLAIFPQGLVDVHPRAVIVEDRFGHEGDGLAILLSDIFDHIFVNHQVVGGVDQFVEFNAQFILATGSDFVVMFFNGNAKGRHG